MKSEAWNAGKNLIETIVAELEKQKLIVNKKTCHGLGSYYKSSVATQSIEFIIIEPSFSQSNNTSNDILTPKNY